MEGGGVLPMSFTVSVFFFFNSHGVADTLESYEVCCSACVLPVIGQVQHWDVERNRDGKDHGLQKFMESVCTSLLFYLADKAKYIYPLKSESVR